MDFGIFDADQHYYESEDAFTRYASQRMQNEKYIRWVTELDGKRKRLFCGGRQVDVIGNPTFDPIARPGVYLETLKNLERQPRPLPGGLRRARADPCRIPRPRGTARMDGRGRGR